MTQTQSAIAANPTKGRWGLVAAALLLQLSIGAVYAWSVFSKALQTAAPFTLTKVEATLPFEVAIGMIFIGTFIGGRIQDRRGPRTVAMVGGAIYGFGVILASFARSGDQLWLLVLGYGVLAGFGLGLAYIVPIAMLQKWFPDRRGLITGLAVGGFGFGAVLTAPIAQWLIAGNPDQPTAAFLPLGIAYLIGSLAGAFFFRNPPQGYEVPGYVTGHVGQGGRQRPGLHPGRGPADLAVVRADRHPHPRGDRRHRADLASRRQLHRPRRLHGRRSRRCRRLPRPVQRRRPDLLGRDVGAAGRMTTFVAILALEGVCLLLIPHVGNAVLFFVLAAVVYLCYGGAFGTMPATAGDFFGVKYAGGIYGLMLIGWSLGGVVGPLIAAALIGADKDYATAYTTIGIIALVSIVLPVVTRLPRVRKDAAEGELGAQAARRT